jgi:hypothetical protein
MTQCYARRIHPDASAVTRVVARWVALTFAPLALTACSPTARLELRFVASVPLDPALFQLTGKKACPPGPVGAPAPLAAAAAGIRTDDAEWQEVHAEPAGLHVITAFRGAHCAVRVTALYDTNRDGKIGSGDLTATSPIIEVSDRGLFRSNLTTGPSLKLVAIP